MLKHPIIGIDLGATYNCVGIWNQDKVEMIVYEQDTTNSGTSPSYVSLTGGKSLPSTNYMVLTDKGMSLYDTAKLQLAHIKYGTGPITYYYPSMAASISVGSDLTVSIRGNIKNPNAQQIDTRKARPALPIPVTKEIHAMTSMLKEISASYLGGSRREAILIVPSYFNRTRKQQAVKAAAKVGFKLFPINNKPMGAVFSHLITSGWKGEKNILVYNQGEVKTDVTILRIKDGRIFEVKALVEMLLGGRDFDNKLAINFIREFMRENNIASFNYTKQMRRIMSIEIEDAKRTLSVQTETRVNVQNFYRHKSYTTDISRNQYDEMIAGVLPKVLEPVKDALTMADMTIKDIHTVLATGGSVQVPKVQSIIRDFFRGKQVEVIENPDYPIGVYIPKPPLKFHMLLLNSDN